MILKGSSVSKDFTTVSQCKVSRAELKNAPQRVRDKPNTIEAVLYDSIIGEVKYDELDAKTNQIRLLELLPDRWTEEIRCELRIAALDEGPAYEALSYVWGNPQDTVEITVNGAPFKATRNLTAALRRLRSSRDSRTLWADAICINQRDLDERAKQFGIMDKVYKSASSVQVFLGESGILDLIPLEEQATWDDPPRFYWHRDGTFLMMSRNPPTRVGGNPQGIADAIFQSLVGPEDPEYDPVDPQESPMWTTLDPEEGIQDQARVDAFFARQKDTEYDPSKLTAVQALRDGQASAFAIMNMLSNGRCLKSCLHADFSSAAWTKALEAIDHLIKLPWWTRVWVLQEAILPQGDVIAIYGEIAAPIGLIEDSGSILPRHYQKGECCKNFWNSLPSSQKDILDHFARLMYGLEGIRDMWSQIRKDQLDMLLLYLQRTRYKEATDPRDKIFGLLGLIRECPNPMDLVPDYEQNVANVYTDIAMRIIRRQRGLFAILNHEEKDLVPGIPTWVPHWSRSFSTLSDYMIIERLKHFLAWPPGPGRVPKLIDHYALEVNGLFVDRITGITKPLVQTETDLAKTIDELETFFGLNDNPFRLYKGGTALADAFWRTMLGDLLYSVDRSMVTSERITFDRALEGDAWMFDIARAAWGNKLRNRFWIKPDGTLFSDEEIAYIANRARENFWYANEGKVFFKTANGYIGSGSPTIRIGDQVFLVFGSLVPLILRSTVNIPPLPSVLNGTAASLSGPWYNLVGYAYVHGIMDGEAAPTRNQVSAGELEKKQRRRKSLYAVGLALARLWPKKKRGVHQIYLV